MGEFVRNSFTTLVIVSRQNDRFDISSPSQQLAKDLALACRDPSSAC